MPPVLPLRILIVNRHIDDIAGGSETQCHEIAEALWLRGHTVVYAVCLPGTASVRHDYALHPLRGRFTAAFRKALEEVRPDVIYWRYNKRYLLRSVLEARQRGIKFVFAVSHINDVRTFSIKPFDGRRLSLVKRALRTGGRLRASAADALNSLAFSYVDAVVFQHAGQIPSGFRRRCSVIYNSRPVTTEASPEDPPAATTTTPVTPYVLWIGSIKKSKNPEEFIRLAREFESAGIGFWMAGAIQDPGYSGLLAETNLPRNFRYLGLKSRPEIERLVADCLFLVHTCDPEGFPNVFIQAWSHAKPVVSLYFDPDGILVANGIGLCAGGYAGFKEDVAALIHAPERRAEMGRRAAAFAAEHCDRDRNVATLEALLADLVKNTS